ncbi:MAG: HAMP domain-containing sensor histidine kinase, partial [Maritimibacter sp.]
MAALARIPLSLRVPLFGAVLMILVGVLASQQVLVTLSRVQDARLRELAKLHVDSLSVALGPHVLREDVWEIYDILKRSSGEHGDQRMVFTAVIDRNHRVIAATDPRRAPIDSILSEGLDEVQSPDSLSIIGDGTRLALTAPLIYQGRVLGDIFTELDVSDLVSERRTAGRYLLLGNALATGVLALLGYFAMRRMLRPITRLAQRMRETAHAPEPIPQGDIPRGDTEVSRLVQTYNLMVEAIDAKAETERRLAERERFVSLGRLSSSLAHEINNPLGGLLNATDTITEYADRPEVVRQSASLLKWGLEHLRDVARATLDHNRLDRSSAPLTHEDFDDLHLLIGPEIKRQQQRLDWQIEADDATMALFASAPLRQIALNLLLNASSAAGIGGTVTFGLSAMPGGVQLDIGDSGSGLSPEAEYRLLSSGPVQPGGGVGLRLVHDLVAELGGEL